MRVLIIPCSSLLRSNHFRRSSFLLVKLGEQVALGGTLVLLCWKSETCWRGPSAKNKLASIASGKHKALPGEGPNAFGAHLKVHEDVAMCTIPQTAFLLRRVAHKRF